MGVHGRGRFGFKKSSVAEVDQQRVHDAQADECPHGVWATLWADAQFVVCREASLSCRLRSGNFVVHMKCSMKGVASGTFGF